MALCALCCSCDCKTYTLLQPKVAELLQDSSGRLLKHMASAADDLDALFNELDLSLTNSRNIFSQIRASNVNTAEEDLAHAAAFTSHPSSVQTQPASGSAELQVPAYVHVGLPLVTEEPVTNQVAVVGDATIDW